MHPVRRQRLIIVVFIVLGSGLVLGLALYALRSNLNLFYPPSQIVSGAAPIGRQIKAGGCVVPGSIMRAADSLNIHFRITDGMGSVMVNYTGPLPDLFGEGQAAVIDGVLQKDGVLNATRVLAKHDENYTPAEVADSLKGPKPSQDEIDHVRTCKGMKYDS